MSVAVRLCVEDTLNRQFICRLARSGQSVARICQPPGPTTDFSAATVLARFTIRAYPAWMNHIERTSERAAASQPASRRRSKHVADWHPDDDATIGRRLR